MSVTVRPYRRGGWEVDITFGCPMGRDCASGASLRRPRSRRPKDGEKIASDIFSNMDPPNYERRRQLSKLSRLGSWTAML